MEGDACPASSGGREEGLRKLSDVVGRVVRGWTSGAAALRSLVVVWAAWVDESQSDRQRDPDTYILAAALTTGPEAEAEMRKAMLALRTARGGKLHWNDSDDARQAAIIQTVRRIPAEHLVVVRSCHRGERDERRRRLCLQRLCLELDALGVETVTLESRGRADDRRDLKALQTFRAQRVVSSTLRMYHQPGPAEPLLWVPDAVCGAVVASRTARTPDHLAAISSSCTFYDI